MELKSLSLHEKLTYFYCSYVREESVDPEVDNEAIRLWDKIKVSRRKCRDRVMYLLNQIENVSSSRVHHLDNTFKAKRELVLLAEGTIGSSSTPSTRSASVLQQVDAARVNNELFQECGALSVFASHLQRSIHAFRSLNFQHMDIEQLESMTHDFQQDMVLMYLLILFNANRQNAVFDRQLFVIGTSEPSYTLVAMIDCLVQLNVLPAFPIKRLMMLFYEWFSVVLGDASSLDQLKLLRKSRHPGTDPSWITAEAKGLKLCKSFRAYTDTAVMDAQDPFYLQKKKFVKLREQVHSKYQHVPHHEMKSHVSSDVELASAPLSALDDEWESRCEEIYRLFLSRMHDLTTFLSNLVILSCGSALNARDKKTFYSRRPSAAEQMTYGINDLTSQFDAPENGDGLYWKWILREKLVVLDVSTLLMMLLFKHFRCSHVCKGEYIMHFFLDANLMGTLTKFMNKDLATYLQVTRQDAEENRTGFYALELELRKQNILSDDKQTEFAVQSTRTVTTILRILQKMTKRKPNVIKNALCRSSSIVWLKRVVSLNVATPRLYALKLVKSQAKYLGSQWVRKYTCFNLLTDVYLYVRPALNDDWLEYEDEDPMKPQSQDSIERLMFGEMQAYHHKYYWEVIGAKPLPSDASLVVEAHKELALHTFDVEGGRMAKFFNELKLEPVQFCQQYEKWLDQESLASDQAAFIAPLPISFA